MPPKQHRLIVSSLRKLWLRSSERYEAIKRARVERGVYRCAACGGSFKQKELQVDHIDEVGAFTSWDAYVERLFCPPSNLQALCKPCHQAKTASRRARLT